MYERKSDGLGKFWKFSAFLDVKIGIISACRTWKDKDVKARIMDNLFGRCVTNSSSKRYCEGSLKNVRMNNGRGDQPKAEKCSIDFGQDSYPYGWWGDERFLWQWGAQTLICKRYMIRGAQWASVVADDAPDLWSTQIFTVDQAWLNALRGVRCPFL